MTPERRYRDFNDAMSDSIDEAVRELLSPQVLEAFYDALLVQYDVTRDELPYRLQTAYKLLTETFGRRGTDTISRTIARRLYEKFDLEFDSSNGLNLMEYIEVAKKKLVVRVERSGVPNEKVRSEGQTG